MLRTGRATQGNGGFSVMAWLAKSTMKRTTSSSAPIVSTWPIWQSLVESTPSFWMALSFSEDSKHFAYAAIVSGKGVIIKDGKEVLRGDGIASGVQAFGELRIGETF